MCAVGFFFFLSFMIRLTMDSSIPTHGYGHGCGASSSQGRDANVRRRICGPMSRADRQTDIQTDGWADRQIDR